MSTNQPDVNLDDDNLMEAMFECQELIARGDACSMCEAEWEGDAGAPRHLIHNPGCLYIKVGDLLAYRDDIEFYLDQAEMQMKDTP